MSDSAPVEVLTESLCLATSCMSDSCPGGSIDWVPSLAASCMSDSGPTGSPKGGLIGMPVHPQNVATSEWSLEIEANSF